MSTPSSSTRSSWRRTTRAARAPAGKCPATPAPDGGLRYLGENVEEYKRRFEIKTGDDPKDWKALIALCKVLNETPLDKLEEALKPILDIDGTLWFLAIDNALINSDGYWTRASDYSIFRDAQGEVPHDPSRRERDPPAGDGLRLRAGRTGFGGRGRGGPGGRPGAAEVDRVAGRVRAAPVAGAAGGGSRPSGIEIDPLVGLDDTRKPLRSRLLAVPSLKARYLDHVRTIAEQWLDWNTLGPVVARYRALIEKEIEPDTRKLTSLAAFQKAVADVAGGTGGGRQPTAGLGPSGVRRPAAQVPPQSPGDPEGRAVIPDPQTCSNERRDDYDPRRKITEGTSMPEWLHTSLANGSDPAPGDPRLADRDGAGAGRGGRRDLPMGAAREPVRWTFVTTLVLLATVIAMATQVIGDNVARAFSLVGALSVVRFRTVVKDTQDTAFVIFAVVVGMASGANHLVVGLVGLGIIVAASLALWPHRADGWHGVECTLSLRIALIGGRPARGRTAPRRVDATIHADLGRHGTPGNLPGTDLSRLPPAGMCTGRAGHGAQRPRGSRERRPATGRLNGSSATSPPWIPMGVHVLGSIRGEPRASPWCRFLRRSGKIVKSQVPGGACTRERRRHPRSARLDVLASSASPRNGPRSG